MFKVLLSGFSKLFLLVLILSSMIFSTAFSSAKDKNSKYPIIILDAGHGGFDGGAQAADGTLEKDINLDITLLLNEFLKFDGYTTVLTRNEDIATDSTDSDKIAVRKKSDLDARLALMKKHPDSLFISIHLNKFTTSSASGAQIFYNAKFSDSKRLAKSIQTEIVKLIQPDNKRVIKCGADRIYLFRKSVVPTVIAECGFLSSHAELEKLKNKEYQSKLAFCIAAGIKDFYKGEEDFNG